MSGTVFTFVREFVAAFFAEARRVFGGESGIEILTQEDKRLAWRSCGRESVADHRLRAVTTNGRLQARFEAIQAIDIQREQRGDSPETWHVCLSLGERKRVHVASSTDATDASILAARLGTLVDRQVRAFR